MSRLIPRPLIGCVLLAAILAACVSQTPAAEQFSASQTNHTILTLPDDAIGSIEARTSVGTITVQVWDRAQQVRVEHTRTAYGTSERDAEEEIDDVTIRIDQDGAAITVDGRQQTAANQRTNRVDLVLSVPPEIGLTLATVTGDVVVDGVRVDGEFYARSTTGDVILTGLDVPGGMRVEGGSGEVKYAGRIGTSGAYSLSASVGNLTVTLPEDTAATVQAETTLGAITVEGFAITPKEQTSETENRWEGALGAAEYGAASLSLTINIGDIRLSAAAPDAN